MTCARGLNFAWETADLNPRGCAPAEIPDDLAMDNLNVTILHATPLDDIYFLCPFLPIRIPASLWAAMARRPISVAGS